MANTEYKIIGVISGTSLDGVDLAYINFKIINNKWTFDLVNSETISYNIIWIQRLKDAINFNNQKLKRLNEDYTQLLSKIVNNFIKKYKIVSIDAVCSHGHTILHTPEIGLTLQIGNLPKISKLINHKVVCDFRIQDVQLGGQGAPLVPIGDKLLFSEYNYCLNLGGFSNISFDINNDRVAFDISPVNTVLNYYSDKLGFPYDNKGEMAQSGKINHELLLVLNKLEYYHKPFPKSLGFEFVKEIVLPIIEKYKIGINDKMRTFVDHVAQQTALVLSTKTGKMLVTGGGTYNIFLMTQLKSYLPNMQFIIPEKKILEFKEAIIFGLLGVLKLRNEINVLASVTGAKYNHSSGKIYN